MAAYLIATIDVKDPEMFDKYRAQVPALVEKYGGTYRVRGGALEVLEGDWQRSRVIVLEFPDMAAIHRFHESEDYAPLIELRQGASVGELIAVEGV